jgi:uncharacterized protein YdeI (YjbR/CyaY-like superfamily)
MSERGLAFETAEAFERWLEAKHERAGEVWVRLAKKGSGLESVTYDEAVEVALCFGWIDGQSRSLDGSSYLQRFTPRRRRSNWAASNVARVERLLAEGRMRPAGLREVEAARADGRWPAP